MKQLLSTYLLFMHFFGWAQSNEFPNLINPQTVTTITYFEVGDVQSYHINEEQISYTKKGKPEDPTFIKSYDLTFKVLSATDSSYHIEMSYSNFQLPTSKKNEDPIIQDIQKLNEQFRIVFVTNELGQYDSIANKQEIIDATHRYLDIISKSIEEREGDDEAKNLLLLVIEGSRKLSTLPENIDGLFADDITFFHALYGFEYQLNVKDPIEMVYLLFDDLEIQGDGTVTLTSINKEADRFTIQLVESPNKEALEALMDYIIERVVPVEIKNRTKETKEVSFKQKRKTSMTFELSTGWVLKAKETTDVTIVVDGEQTKSRTSRTAERK